LRGVAGILNFEKKRNEKGIF
jgi:hypothetical protein